PNPPEFFSKLLTQLNHCFRIVPDHTGNTSFAIYQKNGLYPFPSSRLIKALSLFKWSDLMRQLIFMSLFREIFGCKAIKHFDIRAQVSCQTIEQLACWNIRGRDSRIYISHILTNVPLQYVMKHFGSQTFPALRLRDRYLPYE